MDEKVIEVRDLIKKYGGFQAVGGVSFGVQAGEVFSLLGPNGAGKTTTVEVMECVRCPTSGDVSILGHDALQDQRRIKERIGVMPQAFKAYEQLTVRENIQYFANLYKRSVKVGELIGAVSLQEKTDVMYKNLSGGLKQRVGIAISLVNDPEIVFLDEPTTGLDPSARHEVWKIIQELKARGRTVVLTTHYMEEAEVLSDRVAIMDKGKLIAIGAPREIIDRYGSGDQCLVRGASAEAMEALTSNGVEFERKNGDALIPLPRRSVLPSVVKALESNNASYEEIIVRKPTLEDVFLKLTGRKIGTSEEVAA
jgi:ABC-2 type transport system ATP-binding protein